MNFDDAARFFGPSEKLWLELFAPPEHKGYHALPSLP
jgi:hypothetical protein